MPTADLVRMLLHLLSVLLVLPSFLFASACLMLKRAFTRGSFWAFLDTIFSFLVVMLPWGMAVMIVGFLTLVAAGFSAEWRHAAAGAVIGLAVGSAAIMHRIAALKEWDQVWFYVPGLASALIAGWVFLDTK